MPHTILATDQTETSDDKILSKDWAGKYQLLCTVYAADPVKMQVRVPGGTWIDAKFNGMQIQLTGVGETLDITLVRDYEYQLITENAGAEVVIAKHNIHD